MAKQLKGVTVKRQQGWYVSHHESIKNGCYIPLWRVEDIKSSGIKVKIRHFSDPNRVIHLLSMNELFMYVLIAWDQEIYEVYEQYGISIDASIDIANDLKIAHPVYSDTRTPIIQSIDFMCKRHHKRDIAYLVKQASALDNARTEEKLKIQKHFCTDNKIDYKVVTSDELKSIRYENLERLFRHSQLDQMLRGVFKIWFSNFVGELSDNRYDRVAHILKRSAQLTGVTYQRAAQFFYFAIWVCFLVFDFNKPLVLESAASDLELHANDAYFSA